MPAPWSLASDSTTLHKSQCFLLRCPKKNFMLITGSSLQSILKEIQAQAPAPSHASPLPLLPLQHPGTSKAIDPSCYMGDFCFRDARRFSYIALQTSCFSDAGLCKWSSLHFYNLGNMFKLSASQPHAATAVQSRQHEVFSMTWTGWLTLMKSVCKLTMGSLMCHCISKQKYFGR